MTRDIDGDGIVDQRVGMDNASGAGHRAWMTDLATGETSVNPGPPYGLGAFDTEIETYYLGEMRRDDMVDVTITRPPGGLRFYGWASLIQDGGGRDGLRAGGWLGRNARSPARGRHDRRR